MRCVKAGRDFKAGCPETNYREVRYEELVENPEETMGSLLRFLKEDWGASVLDHSRFKRELPSESSAEQVARPLYETSIERWRNDLVGSARESVKEVAGDLLIELGYAHDRSW